MELVLPSVKYRNSYIAARQEDGKSADENKDGIRFDLMESDFAAFVESLTARSKGKGLPPGYVSDTNYRSDL